MALAQVVYHISNDSDFARQWRVNPEAALAEKGLKLSKEEQEFLVKGLVRTDPEDGMTLHLAEFYGGWYGI